MDLALFGAATNRFYEGSDSMLARFGLGSGSDTAIRHIAHFPKRVIIWGAIGPGFKSDLIDAPRAG